LTLCKQLLNYFCYISTTILFNLNLYLVDKACALSEVFFERMCVMVATAVTNDEKLLIIRDWDLSKPKQFLVVRQGFDPQEVEEMEREYKRYMCVVALNPESKFPISNAVDELWHAHILFTSDYNALGDALRHGYIHHIPTLNEEERAALEPQYFSGTLERYRRLFGEEPPQKYWPSDSGSICWSCT
jgi:hypothetical protein